MNNEQEYCTEEDNICRFESETESFRTKRTVKRNNEKNVKLSCFEPLMNIFKKSENLRSARYKEYTSVEEEFDSVDEFAEENKEREEKQEKECFHGIRFDSEDEDDYESDESEYDIEYSDDEDAFSVCSKQSKEDL